MRSMLVSLKEPDNLKVDYWQCILPYNSAYSIDKNLILRIPDDFIGLTGCVTVRTINEKGR